MISELHHLINLIVTTGHALAEGAGTEPATTTGTVVAAAAVTGKQWFLIFSTVAAGLAMAMATMGTGVGMGLAISKACEGIARQPEAEGKIRTTMIIGLAMIESLAIYALVVVLIILYANPLLGKF